jgi:Transcription factor WhiB
MNTEPNKQPPCTSDPNRWSVASPHDTRARQLCWVCPTRGACAHTALTWLGNHLVSHPVGIWAGVFIPEHLGIRKRKEVVAHLTVIKETNNDPDQIAG